NPNPASKVPQRQGKPQVTQPPTTGVPANQTPTTPPGTPTIPAPAPGSATSGTKANPRPIPGSGAPQLDRAAGPSHNGAGGMGGWPNPQRGNTVPTASPTSYTPPSPGGLLAQALADNGLHGAAAAAGSNTPPQDNSLGGMLGTGSQGLGFAPSPSEQQQAG